MGARVCVCVRARLDGRNIDPERETGWKIEEKNFVGRLIKRRTNNEFYSLAQFLKLPP